MIGDHGRHEDEPPVDPLPFRVSGDPPHGAYCPFRLCDLLCIDGSFVYIKAVLRDVMHLKSCTNSSAYG